MANFSDLSDVLVWLAGAGLASWGMMVSDFFRNIKADWWVSAKPIVRQVVVLAATIVPPVVAYIVLLTVPADVIASLEPHYAFVASLFTAVLAARGIYEIAKT